MFEWRISGDCFQDRRGVYIEVIMHRLSNNIQYKFLQKIVVSYVKLKFKYLFSALEPKHYTTSVDISISARYKVMDN